MSSSQAIEARYMQLRRQGRLPLAAGAELGMGSSGQKRLETLYQAETHGNGTDETVPKFAMHERHIERVMAAGGFCRRVTLPDGRPVLVYPDGAAA